VVGGDAFLHGALLLCRPRFCFQRPSHLKPNLAKSPCRPESQRLLSMGGVSLHYVRK
jgi:hypothetical protein